MNDIRMLVTGANGFVGRSLCDAAVSRGMRVRGATRKPFRFAEEVENVAVGDIDGSTDWCAALRGVDLVIHLAARVHVMSETVADPLTAFRAINVAGTENLARQAAAAGVKRLVYVSSIKVNGESTPAGQAFCEDDVPHPEDPYGLSKWEAEQALHHIAAETRLEVVIVRPPLVYGPGVKGNFAQMLQVLRRGILLPLASVHNRRSLLYLDNLVDALLLCAKHRAAAGRTYLVSDGEDVSTPALLRRLGEALGRPVCLFPFPLGFLMGATALLGRLAQAERLLSSLLIDDARIRRELGWRPPYTLQQGLRATAVWYRHTHP